MQCVCTRWLKSLLVQLNIWATSRSWSWFSLVRPSPQCSWVSCWQERQHNCHWHPVTESRLFSLYFDTTLSFWLRDCLAIPVGSIQLGCWAESFHFQNVSLPPSSVLCSSTNHTTTINPTSLNPYYLFCKHLSSIHLGCIHYMQKTIGIYYL